MVVRGEANGDFAPGHAMFDCAVARELEGAYYGRTATVGVLLVDDRLAHHDHAGGGGNQDVAIGVGTGLSGAFDREPDLRSVCAGGGDAVVFERIVRNVVDHIHARINVGGLDPGIGRDVGMEVGLIADEVIDASGQRIE